MNKFINRFLNIVLIMLITFLVLNQFYIIQFSDSIRDVFIFLTLTTPNVKGDKLEEEIKHYNKSFERLMKRKEVNMY